MVADYTDIVDPDLYKYFDRIPHSELLKSVARTIIDRDVLHLIKIRLKAPVEERDEKRNRRMTGDKGSKQGTLQDGVASPMLANLYICFSRSLGDPFRFDDESARCGANVEERMARDKRQTLRAARIQYGRFGGNHDSGRHDSVVKLTA
jgi:hypothetical protein